MSRPRVLLGISGCWSWGDQGGAGGSGVARVLEAETGVQGICPQARAARRLVLQPPPPRGIPGLSPAPIAVGRVRRAGLSLVSPDPLRASGLMGPPSPSGGPETCPRGRPAWSGALGPWVGHVCPEGMRRDLISEGGCQCFGEPCRVPTWLRAHGSWKRQSPPAPAQEAGLLLLVLLPPLGRRGRGGGGRRGRRP